MHNYPGFVDTPISAGDSILFKVFAWVTAPLKKPRDVSFSSILAQCPQIVHLYLIRSSANGKCTLSSPQNERAAPGIRTIKLI